MKPFHPSILEEKDFCRQFLKWKPSERREFMETLIATAGRELVPGCFRSYDIRIDEKHLSNAVVFYIGLKIVPRLKKITACPPNEPLRVAVGRSAEFARPGSLRIQRVYLNALSLSGAQAIDLGVTTTPDVYFASAYLLSQGLHSAVNVTASHNPKKDSGLKHCIQTPEGFILSISQDQLSEIKLEVCGDSRLKKQSDTELLKNLESVQAILPVDRDRFRDENHLSALHQAFLVAFGLLGKEAMTEECRRKGRDFKKILSELLKTEDPASLPPASLLPRLKEAMQKPEPFKDFVVVLDYAKGTAFRTKEIYSALGATVIPLDLERGLNPVEARNQEHLKRTLLAERKKHPDKEVLGIAHDEDGDRLAVMRSDGVAVEGDRLLAICCRDLQAGDVVVTEVKSRPEIRKFIESKKISAVISPTGFAFIKQKAVDMELLHRRNQGKSVQMWAELSGHFGLGFELSWFFDDASMIAVHLMSCLAGEIGRGHKPGNLLIRFDQEIPRHPSSGELNIFLSTEDPHYIPSSEEKETFVAQFTEKFKDDPLVERLDHTDGIQVFFKNGGWLLIRKSNNEDKLVVVSSAPDSSELDAIERHFLKIAASLKTQAIAGLVLSPENAQGEERVPNAYLLRHLQSLS